MGLHFIKAWLLLGVLCLGVFDVRAEWLLRNPPNFVNTISALAKISRNQWIAVGEGGLIRWSDRPYGDSTAWFAAESGTKEWLRATASGDRLWVVVGDRGVVLTSVDRRFWTPQISGVTNHLMGVASGSDGWMIVGDSGTILRSTDTRVWRRVTIPGVRRNLSSVTRTSTRWAIGGERGLVLSSVNGESWTEHPLPTQEAVSSIRFGKGLWIASAGKRLYTSPDLVLRTLATEADDVVTSLHFNTENWMAVGLNGLAMSSSDGKQWSPLRFEYELREIIYKVTGTQDFYALNYDQGYWFMAGLRGDIWRWNQDEAPDGRAYPSSVNEVSGSATRNPFRSIGVQGSDWRVFGDLSTSLFGRGTPSGAWQLSSRLTNTESLYVEDLFSVGTGASRWICVGNAGGLYESTAFGAALSLNEGVATRRALFDVHETNGRWVAVGENGTIRWWEESRTLPHVWQSALLPALEEGISFFGVGHGNNRWVAVGDRGTILNSEDGRTWSIAAQLGLSGHLSSVFHNGRLWVAVGELGNLWTSVDGQCWRRIDLGTDVNLQHITYGSGQWVAVGDHGSMYGSGDGECWTSVSVPTDVRLWSAEFAVDSWVLAGEGGLGMAWKGTLPLSGPPAGCGGLEEGEVFATVVVREGSEQLRLRWRDTCSRLVLQVAPSLAGPWSKVSVRVTSVDDLLESELPIQLRSIRFYRLVLPE